MGFPDVDVMDWLQQSPGGANLTAGPDWLPWAGSAENLSQIIVGGAVSAEAGGVYAATPGAPLHPPPQPPPPPGQRPPPPFDETLVVAFQAVAAHLNLYGTPACCAAGLLGNLLATLALIRCALWRTSAARYLLAVLASDAAFLANLLVAWLGEVRAVGVYSRGGMCHFSTFLSHGSCFLSLWYLVCFGVDGYIRACCGRRRKLAMCTTTRATVVILALMAVAIAVFINISITFGVTSRGPVPQCRPLPSFIATLRTLFKVDIFLNSMLPDVALIGMLCHVIAASVCCARRCCRTSGKRVSSSSSVSSLSCCCCYPASSSSSPSSTSSSTHCTPSATTAVGSSTTAAASTASAAAASAAGRGAPESRTAVSAERDLRRVYVVFVLVSVCMNVCAHGPRVYYTLHGLLYPARPLTMRHFVWQQVLTHAYNLRCAVSAPVLFAASRSLRAACRAAVTSLAACLARVRRRPRDPSSTSGEDGGCRARNAERDDPGAALMKDPASNPTTAV